MKIYDISMTISEEMQVFSNNVNKRPLITTPLTFKNDGIYESVLSLGLHCGTHIDAPLHMIENGDAISGYDLNRFITPCRVIDLTKVKKRITKNDLIDKNIKKDEFILFKTTNSRFDKFRFDYIYLTAEGASYLVEQKIKGVGIDALSVERDQSDFPTHKTLFNNKIIILEGLRLAEIKEDEYLLIALPLKIDKSEASLCRAVLIDKRTSIL